MSINRIMSWVEWIPYIGERTVRQKIREIKHAGLTLPMFLTLAAGKVVESLVVFRPSVFVRWVIVTALTCLVIVTKNETWDKVKEKAEEVKDKVDNN